jgi:hypothetical protein
MSLLCVFRLRRGGQTELVQLQLFRVSSRPAGACSLRPFGQSSVLHAFQNHWEWEFDWVSTRARTRCSLFAGESIRSTSPAQPRVIGEPIAVGWGETQGRKVTEGGLHG